MRYNTYLLNSVQYITLKFNAIEAMTVVLHSLDRFTNSPPCLSKFCRKVGFVT